MSDNMRGACLMMGSMLAFTLNDTCIKAIGGDLPLFQILLMRGLLSTTLIFLLAWRLDALRLDLPRRDLGLMALRCAGEIGAAYFFLTALFNMPLANVTALLQLLPLTVTLAGALVFREPLGWRRLTAIGVGFLGMLLIVRPGTEGFTVHSVYALISVGFVTLRDLATRRMSRAVPSMTVTLSAALSVTLFAAFATLTEEWRMPDATQAGLMVLSGLFVFFGYLLSVAVMRVGELSFVTPFRYTGLVWALLLGLVVFGDWPVPLTLLGAAVIAGTGIFTLYREGRVKKAPRSGEYIADPVAVDREF
ncbi:EamA family transporter [Aquicoccus sp. SCR17]|nr:EamA family transporter [Carideicomes alvinocaridis]